MVKRMSMYTTLFVATTFLFGLVAVVWALPPLPYTPWGSVTVSGQLAADGTVVTAWIDGMQYALTTTINGDYALDVPGDDPDTPGKQGGEAGDTVVFKVRESTANETGTWNSGSAVVINLTTTIPIPTVDSMTLTPASPVKAETVEFEIAFSQEMNVSITPTVTLWQISPYDAHTVTPRDDAGYTHGYLITDTTRWYGTYAFTEMMPNGTYTVSIAEAQGVFGQWMVTDTGHSLLLDTIPPIGTVLVNDGALYVNSLSVTLNLTVTDLSGVDALQVSNDGSAWSDWETYATTKAWTLTSGDGSKTISVRYKDNAGNVSIPCTDTVTLDTIAPTGSVTIDGGATYAASTAVTLTLSANDATSGLSQRQFSNDGSAWSDWESYATAKAWTLASGDGTKTVYVHYEDVAGNVSTPVTDTVILDTTPPSAAVDPLTSYQTVLTYTVSWSGADALTEIAAFDVQVRDGDGTWTDWTDWITSTTADSGTFVGVDGHTFYYRARARDVLGNLGSYASGDGDASTHVDTTRPEGNVVINGGALATTSQSVTLMLSASDPLGSVASMSFSNDGSSWSDWEIYATTAGWSLSGGDGLKTAYSRFEDMAGNVSSVVSDTIELDEQAGTEYGLSINDAALFTNQVTVTLTIGARPGTVQIQISNDGGFPGAEWEPYASRKAWEITQYGEYVLPRVVYIRYKDGSGGTSATYQDDIILDLNPPTGSVDILPPGSSTEGLRPANRTLDTPRLSADSVTLHLSAEDDVSGVADMMVSNDSYFDGASWEPYATTKSWSVPEGTITTVYVRFRDNAGNVSITYSDTTPARIPLSDGWNLISIPVSPSSTVITDVLSSIEGQYDLVYAYHASDAADPWKKYNTAAPSFLNDLTDIDETMGLWIRATEAVTLTVSGSVPSSTDISLYTGWNLVGYPSQTTRPITEALAGIEGKYDLVYAYDAWDAADPWKKYNTAAPPFLNDLTEMGPGWGYWIRVSEDCVWSVP